MMKLVPLRAFNDNYIWLWQEDGRAFIVDPGDAKPVLKFLHENQLTLAGILLTHHHWDHSGGIGELVSAYQNIPVYGSHLNQSGNVSHPVKEGDSIHCGSVVLSVLEIPGHTLDHLAFYNHFSVFCGDMLFSAGCGRVFEGTYPQMYNSLQKLSQLPTHLAVYCGHEYTLQNLRFAELVEPSNAFIQTKMADVLKLTEQHQPTLPSIMQDEKEMNPFLRCDQESVILSAQHYAKVTTSDPVAIFKILREWKNNL